MPFFNPKTTSFERTISLTAFKINLIGGKSAKKDGQFGHSISPSRPKKYSGTTGPEIYAHSHTAQAAPYVCVKQGVRDMC